MWIHLDDFTAFVVFGTVDLLVVAAVGARIVRRWLLVRATERAYRERLARWRAGGASA